MEKLRFEFSGGTRNAANAAPRIAGVLGSGNLEVLVSADASLPGLTIDITTAARGFGPIWQAVMADVFARWPLAGVRIEINDAGATPAIVSLRVDQALEDFCERGA
jgi:malonate decarboxylase delta subunit